MTCIMMLFLAWGNLQGEVLNIRELSHPASEGSGQVNLFSDGNRIIMSWIESRSRSEGTLYMAIYEDGQFGAPLKIHEAESLFINWADFPKVSASGKMLAAAWPQKNGEGSYSYGIMYSSSFDEGKSWRSPQWLHEDQSETEHGFVSLAPLPNDELAAIWLDGRNIKIDSHGDGGHGSEGDMQLRGRIIKQYGLGEEMLIDDSTCECCGTDLVVMDGTWKALYRNKTPQQVRDIYLAGNKQGTWSPGKAVAQDGWVIHGCPVNGPSIDAHQQNLAVAWFTAAKEAAVYLSVSPDGGNHFLPPRLLDHDAVGRVQCRFLAADKIATLWVSSGEDAGDVVLEISTSGKRKLTPQSKLVISQTGGGRASGFPRMAVLKKGSQTEVMVAFQSVQHKGIELQMISLK